MKERKELTCGTREECAEWIAAQDKGADAFDVVENEQGPPCSVFHRRKEGSGRVLRKRVTRETRADFMHYRRPIVVSMLPGDVISFRLKGTKTTTHAEIATLYKAAMQWEAFAKMAKKRAAKKAKRKERRAA